MSKHDPSSPTDTRRSFIAKGAAAGVGAGMAGVFARPAAAEDEQRGLPQKATKGDVDILKFLAAAELVEDDLWQQYCELAVRNRPYRNALERIDPSLIRYICDDRDDERSHAELINAYLGSIGQTPVNLDPFRTLPRLRRHLPADRPTARGADDPHPLTQRRARRGPGPGPRRGVPLRDDRAGRGQPVHEPAVQGDFARRGRHPVVDRADRDLPLRGVPQVATKNAGAVASATALVESGLFQGQPQAFLDAVVALATAADAAVRGAGTGGSAPKTGPTGATGSTGATGAQGATPAR